MVTTGMNQQVRDQVYLALRRRGLTQTALAERLSISRQHLSGVLTGKDAASAELWQSICQELGLKLIAVDDE